MMKGETQVTIALSNPPSKRGVVMKRMLALLAACTTFCVLCVAAQAHEVLAEQSPSSQSIEWTLSSVAWTLCIPAAALTIYSLIIKRKNGWGWVVTGTAIVLVLLVLQFLWSMITAFRGGSDDDDNWGPSDSWASDGF